MFNNARKTIWCSLRPSVQISPFKPRSQKCPLNVVIKYHHSNPLASRNLNVPDLSEETFRSQVNPEPLIHETNDKDRTGRIRRKLKMPVCGKEEREREKQSNFSDYRSRLISRLSLVIVTLLNKDLLLDDDRPPITSGGTKINFNWLSRLFS